MKRVISASTKAESFLTEDVKTEYAKDLATHHPGMHYQEGLGWLAGRYGLNLIELLDVLDTAVDLDFADCIKPGAAYKIHPFER